MKGTCLCGAVMIEIPDQAQVNACHCGMCRRWGGGPLLAVHAGPGVRMTGSDHVTAYKSSDWAERGFCAKCGTHLYYKLLASSEYTIPAGLFQDAGNLQLNEQIFIDKKPSYYTFANRTRQLTEAEVFAQYSPPAG